MKTCSKCKIEKPLEDFRRCAARKDGRQNYCAECDKKRQREAYASNPSYKDTIQARRRGAVAAARVFVDQLKDNPCSDCGGSFPSVCMDFDHVADDKSHNIAHMVHEGYSIESIQKEVGKCELVCANCHRVRTHDRRSRTGDREA